MSVYFDFETIKELIGNRDYREQREFTLQELLRYDGKGGRPAYVAVAGIVYDVSKEASWAGGMHLGLTAGRDLTEQFNSSHGMIQMLARLPKVGILKSNNSSMGGATMGTSMNNASMSSGIGGNVMNKGMSGSTVGTGMNSVSMNTGTTQNTSNFTPDDWIRYITPLVDSALEETNAGINSEHLYQKIILSGVLVGLGKTPQEANMQVEEWENTGVSELLTKSNMNRGYNYRYRN